MTTEIRWLASVSASAFHALDRLARGLPLIDAELGELLSPHLARAVEALHVHHARLPELLAHVIPIAATVGNNHELAEFSLRKTFGPPIDPWLQSRLVELFTGVESAMAQHAPGLVDELELRSQPLREQWEARGGGLLLGVRRWTEEELVPERADAILVRPAAGGGGAAHVPYNSIRVEAMLVNGHPELPEVLRVAWLVSQLNADLPRYQGDMRLSHAVRAMSLALVPIVLAAGETVELSVCTRESIERAVRAWELAESWSRDSQVASAALGSTGGAAAGPGSDASQLAELAWQWWNVYQDSRPGWSVALAALEQMTRAE